MNAVVYRYRYVKARNPSFEGWHTIAFLSLLSFVAGTFILGYASWSTVGWLIWDLTTRQRALESPVVGEVLGMQSQASMLPNIQVTRLESGFPAFTTTYQPKELSLAEFRLSIPKLAIADAKVRVNSLDFMSSLAHFPDTALPGGEGNVFISGHSVLPQFFNPTDYTTIFSTLPSLETGDTVQVNASGLRYTYTVIKKRVVDPKDISVLLPPYPFGKYLTLMTCVPPGLNSRRLVVIARLET